MKKRKKSSKTPHVAHEVDLMMVGGGIHIIFYKRGLCLYLLRSIFLLKNVWDILATWTTCTTLNEQSVHDSAWPVCICLCLLWLPFHPNRSKQMTPPSRVGVCSRFFGRLGSFLPLFGAAPERSAGFLSDCAKHCEVPVDVFCALLIKVDWLIDWKPCEVRSHPPGQPGQIRRCIVGMYVGNHTELYWNKHRTYFKFCFDFLGTVFKSRICYYKSINYLQLFTLYTKNGVSILTFNTLAIKFYISPALHSCLYLRCLLFVYKAFDW